MRAVAGEVEANHAVDDVEGAGAQVDVFVGEAQGTEHLEYLHDLGRRHDGARVVGAARVGQAGVGVGELIDGEQAVDEGVVHMPQGAAAGGEVQLAVVHAVFEDQLAHDRQHLIQVAVHQTFGALVLEDAAADRRVALDLAPGVRLAVQVAGERQFAQVVVGAEKAAAFAVLIADHLNRGE